MDVILTELNWNKSNLAKVFENIFHRDGRLRTSARTTAELEKKLRLLQTAEAEEFVLYRLLQNVITGAKCDLDDQDKDYLTSNLLAAESHLTFGDDTEIDYLSHPNSQCSSEFDRRLYEYLGSALQGTLSTVAKFTSNGTSGTIMLNDLSDKLEQKTALEQKIVAMEYSLLKSMVMYELRFLEYVQLFASTMMDVLLAEEQYAKANVTWLNRKTEALTLKTRVTETRIVCETYTKTLLNKLFQLRGKQIVREHELERRLKESEELLRQYDAVDSPQFRTLVKQYGNIQKEIELTERCLMEYRTSKVADAS